MHYSFVSFQGLFLRNCPWGGGAVYIRDLLVMTEGTRKLWDMLTKFLYLLLNEKYF